MNEYSLDARIEDPGIRPALPRLGGASPAGDRIAFTNAFMTRNGQPWLAVAGELHYARCPRDTWREALLMMKAAGVDIVSTYVFWIHHEEVEGRFDWSGDRDLRAFVGACAAAGVYVMVRVGPFCHGEVRNGGIPDWLYGRPFALRSSDEGYLAHVRRLYGEIGGQLRGLFFGQGGPIIAVQLENELGHAGAPWETVPRLAQEWVTAGAGGTIGAEHLRTLRRIAGEAGIEAPIFAATAWGGAAVLPEEALPLYGGYAFCPWNITESTPDHAPTRQYIFRNYRAPARRDADFDPPYPPDALPYACCEMGGGMQKWYRYRFTVPPESVDAMAIVKLAGGCSLLGYYMFHGGSNPLGQGYLNEHVVPRISYDFQAPIGEFGQARESSRRLRRVHLFCRSFGELLGPMGVALPEGAEEIDPRETWIPRYAARVRGDAGFLFLCNYQDHAATADHEDIAVSLTLRNGSARFPSSGGFTLRAGCSAIMPFNLDLDGVLLASSTAQPLARLALDDATHFFFFQHDGIPAEHCFRGVEGAGGDGLTVMHPPMDLASPLTLKRRAGRRVVIHTLTETESLGFSVLTVWGRQRAIITEAEAYEDNGSLHLRSSSPERRTVDVLVLPAPGRDLHLGGAACPIDSRGPFGRFSVAFPEGRVQPEVRRHGEADAEITLPADAFDNAAELLLTVEYDGDMGSAFIDGALVADDFAGGPPWEIGLRKLRSRLQQKGMYLHISPRREGRLVVRESGMAMQQELRGREIAHIGRISAVAVREVVID